MISPLFTRQTYTRIHTTSSEELQPNLAQTQKLDASCSFIVRIGQITKFEKACIGAARVILVAALKNGGITLDALKPRWPSDLFNMQLVLDNHLRETPAGRMGTLKDMAEAARWLANDETSAYVNGQVIDLAGGQQMGHLPR